MVFNVHGSEDSIDVDVMVAVDERWMQPHKPHALVAECKRLTGPVASALGLPAHADVNVNLCVARDGVLVWVAKGDASESNNGLLRTYGLHRQLHPPLATRAQPRLVNAKLHRGLRSLLGCFTRTQHRALLKAALRSNGTWRTRLDALHALCVADALRWEQPMMGDACDELKRAAFQAVQMVYLLQQREVFTKAEVVALEPALQPFMYRQPQPDLAPLWALFGRLAAALEAHTAAGFIAPDSLELRDHGTTGENGQRVAPGD